MLWFSHLVFELETKSHPHRLVTIVLISCLLQGGHHTWPHQSRPRSPPWHSAAMAEMLGFCSPKELRKLLHSWGVWADFISKVECQKRWRQHKPSLLFTNCFSGSCGDISQAKGLTCEKKCLIYHRISAVTSIQDKIKLNFRTYSPLLLYFSPMKSLFLFRITIRKITITCPWELLTLS